MDLGPQGFLLSSVFSRLVVVVIFVKLILSGQRYPIRAIEDNVLGTETLQDVNAELYYHRVGTLQCMFFVIIFLPVAPLNQARLPSQLKTC